MFNGAFALLERSLRVDSRAWSTHLARLGLMVSIYCSLCFAMLTSFMFGAPGQRFFSGIAYLDITFMTLLGVGFFSTSITEEKEEDTLGLMMMAGISPLGILAGKSGGRLWQSLLLIAVQYPFVLLAVTLGGVMVTQVWTATIALLAYMIFLAGFGLLCSTLAPRSQKAAAWMVVGLIVYFVVPLFAKQFASDHAAWLLGQSPGHQATTILWTLVGGIGDVCVFLEMGTILTTGFGGTALSVQVITNALAGILCTGLSWLCFGMATRNPATEVTSRGLVSRNRAMSSLSAGRAWNNPFVWKDFHFVAGGTAMVLVRTAYYGGMGILALYLENRTDASEWFALLLFLIWLSVTIDASRLVARLYQDEIRGQTLAAIMMLPRSPVGIVYAKNAGALMGWLPGPIIGLIVSLVSPNLRAGLWEAFINQEGGWLMMLTFILYFALIPHFAALFSVYVRWGSVALAICLTIAVYFGLMVGLGLFSMLFSYVGGAARYANSQHLFFGIAAFSFFCLCLACHVGVNLRIQALAAK